MSCDCIHQEYATEEEQRYKVSRCTTWTLSEIFLCSLFFFLEIRNVGKIQLAKITLFRNVCVTWYKDILLPQSNIQIHCIPLRVENLCSQLYWIKDVTAFRKSWLLALEEDEIFDEILCNMAKGFRSLFKHLEVTVFFCKLDFTYNSYAEKTIKSHSSLSANNRICPIPISSISRKTNHWMHTVFWHGQ